MVVLSGLFAILFAVVHVGIGWLTFLDRTPRSQWLSAAGGVAVAYVFLHILPELAEHRGTFAVALGTTDSMAEGLVYSLALAGLIVFYALERAIKTSRRRPDQGSSQNVHKAGTFWLHIGSFAVYNLIIGYLLLHREEPGLWSLPTYGVAMTLHFVTNDFGLRKDHERRYDDVARWVLAAAVIGGWGLGRYAELSELWIAFLFAFLAGGIVLNVLKEELPEEKESRLWPFVGAAVAYAVLLLSI
jgi:zinc transporter ZupT